MASLGHVAIGIAAGRAYAGPAERRRLVGCMFAFAVASLLPDADVLGFPLGIPYGAPFGHRGATHSLFVAVSCGVLVTVARWTDLRREREQRGIDASQGGALRLGVTTALVIATHGSLDAMTDGGRGIALLWPFSTRRIFFPWRPIPVAPIGAAMFSREGLGVLLFELVAFLPLLLYAVLPRPAHRRG
jgi:inner membrane protein